MTNEDLVTLGGCGMYDCPSPAEWRVDVWRNGKGKEVYNHWGFSCSPHLPGHIAALHHQVLVRPVGELVPDMPMQKAADALEGRLGQQGPVQPFWTGGAIE